MRQAAHVCKEKPMSYICLLANKNGAAVSGDTRTSKNFAGEKPFKVMNDKRRKVFISDSEKVIWALAGVTTLFGWDYFKQLRRVMKKDSVLFEVRLENYIKIMKKATRRYHRRFRTDGSSTILFASYMKEENPEVGSITVKNGEVISDVRYDLPVFAEAGSNFARLTEREKFRPGTDDTVARMKMNAARRTAEAVRVDRRLSEEDVFYRPAVGGSVLVKAIKAGKTDETGSAGKLD